jgi:hypothetical protein
VAILMNGSADYDPGCGVREVSMARAFTDPAQEPALEAVEAVMADLGPRLRGLLNRTSGLSSAWTFRKGGGWLLRIRGGRKALCYVIPCDKGFVVRATVREGEREALSQVDGLEPMRPELGSARRYPEGYLVQVEVFDADSADLLDRFINALMELRGL